MLYNMRRIANVRTFDANVSPLSVQVLLNDEKKQLIPHKEGNFSEYQTSKKKTEVYFTSPFGLEMNSKNLGLYNPSKSDVLRNGRQWPRE